MDTSIFILINFLGLFWIVNSCEAKPPVRAKRRIHGRMNPFRQNRDSSLLFLEDGNHEFIHYKMGDLTMLADGALVSASEVVDEEESDGSSSWNDYLNTLFDPVFDPDASSNISAVVGQTAHLPCRVNNLGTKTVSWIRHRDTHILTVGSFPYTGDKRFSALHREGTNEWTLQIYNARINDSGLYECQVSTKPVRAYLVQLDVLVPTASILHAPVLHTDEGGVLNLTCIVAQSPSPPEYIFWYHRDGVINYETDKRVSVRLRQEEGQTVSSLVVSPASMMHSGAYTCEPSNAESAHITVHLYKAEEPAAMQTSSGRTANQLTPHFFHSFIIFYLSSSTPLHLPLINFGVLGLLFIFFPYEFSKIILQAGTS